jgi:hypothetical protein
MTDTMQKNEKSQRPRTAKAESMRRGLAVVLLLGTGAGVAVACAGEVKNQPGLEVLISTNLAQNQYNALHVEVQQEKSPGSNQWSTLLNQTNPVPNPTTLPTRVSIAAGSAADQEALVTVTALLGTQPVVQEVAQVQVPTDRVGELDVFLAQTCIGKLSCNTGTTCDPNSGQCISNVVMSVPDYAGATGGGGSGGGGSGGMSSGTSGPPDATVGHGCAGDADCGSGMACVSGVCVVASADGGVPPGCDQASIAQCETSGGCPITQPDKCGCAPPCGTGSFCQVGIGCSAGSTSSGNSSGTGPCGQPNEPCCQGSMCNPGQATCNASTNNCDPCGNAGEACCQGACFGASNLTCTNNVCVQPCGSVAGGPCCADNTCPGGPGSPGGPFGSGLMCSGGLCQKCGAAGQTCCPYNSCFDTTNGMSGCCVQGVCYGSNSTCPASVGGGICAGQGPMSACQQSANQGCGGQGSAPGSNVCCPGNTCVAPDMFCGAGGQCRQCGYPGMQACPDGTCQNGSNNVSGMCVSCGGLYNTCCTSGTACQGNYYCDGGTCL